jgi:hypothetical protein
VCIFVYAAADRPLEGMGETGIPIKNVKSRERRLLPAEHVYLAFGGCACDLTLDGADESDKAKRDALLDQLERFLAAATRTGRVYALATDGDRRTTPKQVTLTVSEVRDFDFDSAWDAPTLLTITDG